MIVTVVLFELHIEHATSLKEKRMVVKSLRDRLRGRFEISVAEVAFHDLHQRARFAFSFVSLDDATAESMLDKMLDFIESAGDGVLSGWTAEKLPFDETAPLGGARYDMEPFDGFDTEEE